MTVLLLPCVMQGGTPPNRYRGFALWRKSFALRRCEGKTCAVGLCVMVHNGIEGRCGSVRTECHRRKAPNALSSAQGIAPTLSSVLVASFTDECDRALPSIPFGCNSLLGILNFKNHDSIYNFRNLVFSISSIITLHIAIF
jgi:hypothetical protein